MSLTAIPSLWALAPAAVCLNIAGCVTDKYAPGKHHSKISNLINFAQTATACLIGLSIVGPTATAYVGFGAFLVAHATCKILSAHHNSKACAIYLSGVSGTDPRCRYHVVKRNRFERFDNYLSLVAGLINAIGLIEITLITTAGYSTGFNKGTAINIFGGLLSGLLIFNPYERIFP